MEKQWKKENESQIVGETKSESFVCTLAMKRPKKKENYRDGSEKDIILMILSFKCLQAKDRL